MKEREPSPEADLNLTSSEGKGSARFSLKKALIGATIGAIALPLAAFGTVYLAAGLPNITSSELPKYISIAALQAATGAVLGGITRAWR